MAETDAQAGAGAVAWSLEQDSPRGGVQLLTAPYALLVEALGSDGTAELRDEYKQMCQWRSEHGAARWEVYDYKVGTCYDPQGLEREAITEWHVQGTPAGLRALCALLAEASERMNAEVPAAQQEEAAARARMRALLERGMELTFGEKDEDGFFISGGLEISEHRVRAVAAFDGEEHTAGVHDDCLLAAHRALGAYLELRGLL